MKTPFILSLILFASTVLILSHATAQVTNWEYGDATPYPDPKLWARPQYSAAEKLFSEGQMPTAEDLERLQGFYTFEECARPTFTFKDEFFALIKTPTQVLEENAKYGVDTQVHHMGFFGAQDSNIGHTLRANPKQIKLEGLLEYLKDLYLTKIPKEKEFIEKTGVRPIFYTTRNAWGNAESGFVQVKPKFERGSYRLPSPYPPYRKIYSKELRIHADGSLLLKLDLRASKDHIYCVRSHPVQGVAL